MINCTLTWNSLPAADYFQANLQNDDSLSAILSSHMSRFCNNISVPVRGGERQFLNMALTAKMLGARISEYP